MADLTRLYNFTAGTVIDSEQIDAEFDQLIATINDLDTANYKDGSVTTPKLADDAVTPAKLQDTGDFTMHSIRLGSNGGILQGGSSEYSYGAAFHIFRDTAQAATAQVYAAGFNVTSDRRLKERIRPFEDGLATVRRLRAVRYSWKASGQEAVGVIAQEVEETLPEAVHEDDRVGHLTVDSMPLVAVLLAAVNELADRVETLEKR